MKIELIQEYNDKLEIRYSVYKNGEFIDWSPDEDKMILLMEQIVKRAKELQPKKVLKVMEVK